MKISLEWIREFLPGGALDASAVAEALTHGGFPVESIGRVGDDTVIDVEVTSNRGDCLSHAGVAREIAALMGREFAHKSDAAAEAATPVSTVTKVRIDDLELCPHYTARVIRNVKICPSPPWMTRRLEAVGLRPINNVVDVTNYVMFELGQPLHAFDFDKIGGREIVVRQARMGEHVISIDGHERQLRPPMLAICDARIPIALAGVMGGRDSEVSDSTVNVLLESARFDPLSVRRTGRALAMKSDSSYRFERGIDPALPLRASFRAAQLILETAGGELLAGVVEAGSGARPPRTLELRVVRLARVLGIEIPAQHAIDALDRLQLSPRPRGDRIEVSVPSWRLDVNIEADLIEEVARVIGYDKIPVCEEIAIRLTPPEPALRATETIRRSLVAAGYFEAVTVSFVSDALAGDFRPADAASLPRAAASVRKADAHLRASILPGLLEAVRRNESSGNAGARLFEIGSTFWLDAAGELVERRRLGLVGSEELREVRGAVEVLLDRLDSSKPVVVVPEDQAGFQPGACGRIEWGGRAIGFIGRINRASIEKLALRATPAGAALDLSALLEGAQHVPQLRALPRFPSVRRDLSLIVAEATRYQEVEELLRSLALEHLEEIEYVTTYRGKPLERGTKSVTVTLIFRSPAVTLTSEQIEASVQRAVAAAKGRLGATLRV
jgi:phenylalanyl-tRNA synthetase beta chain